MNSGQDVIKNTIQYVRSSVEGEGSGHDWWHVWRVYNNALAIGVSEGANQLVVGLAALLHEIADYKFNDGSLDAGAKNVRAWLEKQNVDEGRIEHICKIVSCVSFKGAGEKNNIETLEGMIVQDADRLDAIGAIGIARVFTFGGNQGREIYDPEIKPVLHKDFDDYKNAKTSSINHFYEKLLLLKDRMNTETAKKMAVERHEFMLKYLEQFYREWG